MAKRISATQTMRGRGSFGHRLLSLTASAVAALCFLAPAPSGLGSLKPSPAATTSMTGAVPSKLIGRWSRNVTQADWQKYGQSFPVGVWSFAVARNGSVGVYTPYTRYVDFRTAFAVSGGRLTIDSIPICPTKGQYLWKVSGRLLTIKEVADTKCRARAALFTGVWKRK